MRTRATRALDALGLAYRLLEFEAEAHTAAEAAARLGLPPEQVFKTLVVRSDRGEVFLACVPGSRELDLRALARSAGVKRMEMADASALVRLVGYIKGAVSPLGTRRRYPVFIDASALDHAHISVSAGVRGLQIWIDPQDLIRATGARVAPLTASEGRGA
ncbi:MAG: Cys-tRNA(Pro) deacylase [Armatimonadota bacterium]|nr:Cys-tRNA(Pro) deacylase [Armatimonadota bacterium]